jgi:predicted KAP-like P-loop ATPase
MSGNTLENRYGFTDERAEEDRFGITDYIGGLARFIEKCNTPMTISIQGTWGTGKTSIMNNEEDEKNMLKLVRLVYNSWKK